MQVVHISGELDWENVERYSENLQTKSDYFRNYFCFPYLHERMGAALAAADMVVSRAGASSLGEYPLFGLPAILVPYPHAWVYQRTNAGFLSEQGAAVVIRDEYLNSELLTTIRKIMGDREKLLSMSKAMRSLLMPNAAEKIAEELVALCGERVKVKAL